MFFAIGHIPASQIFDGLLEKNEQGYLVRKEHTMSNVDGVFIAGDIEDFRYRQAITAAGAGCKAAIDAARYLNVSTGGNW